MESGRYPPNRNPFDITPYYCSKIIFLNQKKLNKTHRGTSDDVLGMNRTTDCVRSFCVFS